MARSSPNLRIRRILAVGREVSQLSSGANLLTQAGYAADLVVTVDRAMRRATVGRYHLAIVTTTFSSDQQLAIRVHLKEVKPGLPVLLLGPEHDSPAAFLESVSTCFGRPKTADIAAHLSDRRSGRLIEARRRINCQLPITANYQSRIGRLFSPVLRGEDSLLVAAALPPR